MHRELGAQRLLVLRATGAEEPRVHRAQGATGAQVPQALKVCLVLPGKGDTGAVGAQGSAGFIGIVI